MRHHFKRSSLLVLLLTFTAAALCSAQSDQQVEAELVRGTELSRIKALVDKNVEAAQRLIADDFQLINPGGHIDSKEGYLGNIASGVFFYKKWEPGDMEIRVYDSVAAVRYKSEIQLVVMNQDGEVTPHWHTNIYEKREGRWQIVWSQETVIQ